METLAIGSTVRMTSKVVVTKSGPKRLSQGNDGGTLVTVARRSIVAMLSDESGHVSLVSDDLAPEPLGRMGKFQVAPMFNSVGVEVKECVAAASDVMPLLDFEELDHSGDIDDATNIKAFVQKYKDHGDRLLLLHDYTSAISYYEAALSFVSSKFDEIGGTLVVKKKGHSVIAEVDCIDDDDKNNPQYDVTYLSGEEGTISRKEILFAVWTKDVSSLQTRVLLNLSRCLLKLADLDNTVGNARCAGESRTQAKSSRQERYRLAAVLGCSIAIPLTEYHAMEMSKDSESELNSLIEKARIVRSRAFLGLRKMPHATVDAKKVLAHSPANREAKALLSEIKAIEVYNKSVDKKLSQEVCRWVQSATNSSKGGEAMERMDDSSVSDNETEESGGDTVEEVKPIVHRGIDTGRIVRNLAVEIVGMFAFLVAMWIVYRPATNHDQIL